MRYPPSWIVTQNISFKVRSRSCSTGVLITYLPQVNAMQCSEVKITLTLLQYCIAVVGISGTATATQLAAVYYERSFTD